MIFDFAKSTKPKSVEEPVDYYFYRRLAHLLVPLLYKLHFTPNLVTLLSLVTGLTASYLVYHQHFIASVFVALLAIVFDCCDGQLARLTGKSSPIGRALDGLCDTIWVSLFGYSVIFSGYFKEEGIDSWMTWCGVAAAFFTLVHCGRYDGIKIKFTELTEPNFKEQDLDVNGALTLAKEKIKKLNFLMAFLALFIALQTYLFVRKGKKEIKINLTDTQRNHINNQLEPLMKKWVWLGEGTHNTLLLIGVLLAALTPYGLVMVFGIILVPMNFLWIYLEIRWKRSYKE